MIISKVTTSSGAERFGITDLLAFAAIYFLWGGTFLAIRIAVMEIPPFFTAGVRFFTAGALLFGFLRLRGYVQPSLKEWRNLALIAFLMFAVTYGLLFWAMKQVSSGMTAVLEATLPITMISLEVFVFRTQALRWRVALGVGSGFLGVMLLLVHNGGQQLAPVPCLVILIAGVAWSLGTVLSKRLALPQSRPLSAGAQMMLGGLVLLCLSFATGELHVFPRISAKVGIAILYLVIFGSIIAYTAYVWLLARFSATQVSSHAYVNPLVAVVLGHLAAGEIVTVQSLAASLIIVASVFLILMKEPPRETSPSFMADARRSPNEANSRDARP